MAKFHAPAKLDPKERSRTIQKLLEGRKEQIEAALPKHIRADKLIRAVFTEIAKNPLLMRCTESSLYQAVMEASHLGLEFGTMGWAYLVPFKNNKKGGIYECKMITGYRGLIKLAMQSEKVLSVEAHPVYSGDRFFHEYGTKPVLAHSIELLGDRGEFVGAYAIAGLVGGDRPFVVMTRSEIEDIRNRSMSYRKGSGPWHTDFDEMAAKTAVRRLCKVLPCEVELAQAIAHDEATEFSIGDVEIPTEEEIAAIESGETRKLPEGDDRNRPNGAGSQPETTKTPAKGRKSPKRGECARGGSGTGTIDDPHFDGEEIRPKVVLEDELLDEPPPGEAYGDDDSPWTNEDEGPDEA